MQEDSPIVDFLQHFPIAITCPICEEQYDDKERIPLLLCDGQHYICQECLNKSLNYVQEDEEILCPFCKEPLFEDRVKNFRLMQDVMKALEGLHVYNGQVKAFIDDLLRENRKMERELEEEKKINENKSQLVKNLYIEIEKRERERAQEALQDEPMKSVKKSKDLLTSCYSHRKSKSVKDQKKNSVTTCKNKSMSKVSITNKKQEIKQKPKRVETMTDKQEKEESIEEKLSKFDMCFSQEDELPLQPITINLRKNPQNKNKNKKPLPYFVSNTSSINPDQLKMISKSEESKDKREKDPRKFYISLLVKYDLWKMKELNLAKMNLIESHVDALLQVDSSSFCNLTKLTLSHNRFSLVPGFVFKLKTLQYLNVSNNCLVRVSDQLGELVNLQVLDLWKNKLTVVPFVIYKLKLLRKVDLSNNKIHSVQPWMLEENIKIDLFGNPLILNQVENQKKTHKSEVFLSGFIKKLHKSMI